VDPGRHLFLAEAAVLPPRFSALLGLLAPLNGEMSRSFNRAPAFCHAVTVYEPQQTRELRGLLARIHRGPEALSW
jgi:hypothetical protein